MRIRHAGGKTKYGPGVVIELNGNEIATAIESWLVAHGVRVNGPRTISVNCNLIDEGQVYVDPDGFVINSDGVKFSGRGWERLR